MYKYTIFGKARQEIHLECEKRGVKIEQVVSDGAQGLKKGIAEAQLGIQHQLDLFHTLWEALRVERGLTPVKNFLAFYSFLCYNM